MIHWVPHDFEHFDDIYEQLQTVLAWRRLRILARNETGQSVWTRKQHGAGLAIL